jgi:dihydroorotase
MKIIIQQAFINDLKSPHHGSINDILIENGFIKSILPSINESADLKIEHKNLHISTGWVDIFSNFCDPGYEYKESLQTGAEAAAAGGYTDVFVIPNTRPVIDTKSQIEYIIQKSKGLGINVLPIGAITKNTEGKELAEMYDMKNSGAIAFSDGIHPVQSAGLLLKALQYIKAFDGVIIQIPDDKSVGANGLINEGIVSTKLGLPGKPVIAEELIIERDIRLTEYAGSKIHFSGITCLRSIDHIRRAKENGLQVTCSVAPYHLFFSDEDLLDYDTNLKVYPPLRTKSEVSELKNAVLDGTVDCIASHHFPHEYDSKILEFEYAKFGMTGLETTYSVLKTALPKLTDEKLIALINDNPRKIFGLKQTSIAVGNESRITLFDPGTKWSLTAENIRSKSKNTPFVDKVLQGKVIGIINGDKVFLNN